MSIDQNDAAFVRDFVRQQSAIHLDRDQDYLIENRLSNVTMTACIAGGIPELVQRARNGDPKARRQIVEAITTHETSFLRDAVPFDALVSTVLPRLIKARQATKRLFIWSAACSTGQEPYSIAMLLRERFPELATWNVKILATDLSLQILETARAGRFRQVEINRGLPAALMVRYFKRDGAEWQLDASVRAAVEFAQLNLIEPWTLPTPGPDIVFLRNVLIYFDVPTKKRILDRVRTVIARDGTLFLGAAETTLNVADGWQRDSSTKAAFYTVSP